MSSSNNSSLRSSSPPQLDRRAAAASIAGALFAPAAALASAGESPKFSVFGIIGDGTSLSEGAAYGSDQKGKTYSPYSVYGESGADSKYVQAGGRSGAEYVARKKAVITETKVRLGRLDAYIQKKKWYEVKNEVSFQSTPIGDSSVRGFISNLFLSFAARSLPPSAHPLHVRDPRRLQVPRHLRPAEGGRDRVLPGDREDHPQQHHEEPAGSLRRY